MRLRLSANEEEENYLENLLLKNAQRKKKGR